MNYSLYYNWLGWLMGLIGGLSVWFAWRIVVLLYHRWNTTKLKKIEELRKIAESPLSKTAQVLMDILNLHGRLGDEYGSLQIGFVQFRGCCRPGAGDFVVLCGEPFQPLVMQVLTDKEKEALWERASKIYKEITDQVIDNAITNTFRNLDMRNPKEAQNQCSTKEKTETPTKKKEASALAILR